MKNLLCLLCAILLFGLFGNAHATIITVVPHSPLDGPLLHKPYFPIPQNNYQAFINPNNLAYVGNNEYSQAAVASTAITSPYAPIDLIHQPEFANDGFYGNGASWISDPFIDGGAGWIKIDLGIHAWIDGIMFGRDRLGGYDDRDPGQFTIATALTDNIYANGDDSNDTNEYNLIVDSSDPVLDFDGYISWSETILVSFDPVLTRYVKMYFTNGISGSVAIDEVEIFGSPVPEPATMLLLGSGLVGLAGFRRKLKTRRR